METDESSVLNGHTVQQIIEFNEDILCQKKNKRKKYQGQLTSSSELTLHICIHEHTYSQMYCSLRVDVGVKIG